MASENPETLTGKYLPGVFCLISMYALSLAYWYNRALIILLRRGVAITTPMTSGQLTEIAEAAGAATGLLFVLYFLPVFLADTFPAFARWLLAIALLGIMFAGYTWLPDCGWQ